MTSPGYFVRFDLPQPVIRRGLVVGSPPDPDHPGAALRSIEIVREAWRTPAS